MRQAADARRKCRLLCRLLAVPYLSLIVFLLTAGSALASGQPDRTPLIGVPPGGVASNWQRTADSPSPIVIFPHTSHSCRGWHRAWTRPDGTHAGLVVWTCQFSNDAAVALWHLLFLQFRNSSPAYPYFHPSGRPDFWAETSSGSALNDKRETVILYARSRYLVLVAALTPEESAVSTSVLATEMATMEASRLPGPTSHVIAPPLVSKGITEFISGAVLAYLAIVLPLRSFRNPLSGQRYQVRKGDPRWHDMTPEANRLKWLLRLRGLARGIFYLASAAIAADVLEHHSAWSAIIFAVVAGWFGWIRPVGRNLRRWKVRRVRGLVLLNHNGWLELVFAAASFGCVVCGLAFALLGVFVYSSGIASSPLVVDGALDARYLNLTSAWQRGLLALLVATPAQSLLEVCGLLLLLLLGAAALLRRFGRRFALADAIRAQEADSRPPILYLRNFSEDVLKMPSSTLARTSLIERLSIVRNQPFEEILVRHLRTRGPVIALSHPSARLPAIGAAKLTLPNDRWQEQIETWIAKAGIVVVAVTPPSMSDSLRWEIQQLAQVPTVPVVLVLSPYRERDLVTRWWQFAMEAIKLPRFTDLSRYAEHNSGAHFMTEHPDFGWIAWGASRRSEFSYAATWWEASMCAEQYRQAMNATDKGTAGPTGGGQGAWAGP
jgi:hypothetical protein